MTFKSFNLDPRVMSGVEALGYEVPTPIQNQAIPPVMQGRDVMGLAQTGTGKTAAFVLPILQRLLDGPRGHVRALILAPTRELAEQIDEAIKALGVKTGLRSLTLYGGVGIHPQIQTLRKGVEIVVACPGRLLDHLSQRTITLQNLEVLVLDEADHMFDMGFLPDVRRILRHVPVQRQTLMFSATMPDDIRHLAEDVLHNPITVQVGHSMPIATVSHALYPVPSHLKTDLLMELLKHTDTESVLIFTRTKHRAKRLGENLDKAGYSATSLQGNLSQNRRQAALDGFRDGKYQIMVATDIAARGIDVSSISHVINYDVPGTADAYTHRIGRTGRAAKTGDAFTLVSEEDAVMVRTIERVLGTKVERRTVAGFDYGKGAPARSNEFARAPREPQRRRPQPTTETPRARQSNNGSSWSESRPAQDRRPQGNQEGQRRSSQSPNSSGFRGRDQRRSRNADRASA
ncbi:MAG: ATP-dependent helicase RhlE [Chloroflexia bacterium]|nr:ATP-dependent helicase RhlE [Chloroflexia bacterium]